LSVARAGTRQVDERAVAAARTGDQAAFAALAEPHRPELQVHCYRMLGSFDESEDLVQETFLRAWHRRESYAGRAPFRAWLYRIATNVCLDFLGRQPRQRQRLPTTDPDAAPLPPAAIPWLQPFPDQLLDPVAPRADEPDAAVVSKETIELAFMVAIQHLTPRQRAVLILRDLLGWPAKDTAALLDTSVASVNSLLQRARPTLRQHLPQRRLDWEPVDPTAEERAVLRRYMDAIERADDNAIAELLREDARVSHQPGAGGHMGTEPGWYQGRETILAGWAPALHGPDALDFRFVATRANRQAAAAAYVRGSDDATYRPFGFTVLRIEDGAVVEVTVFGTDLFPAFGLPATL
jgi:RNA polymerase sigma-70 factor, ECF subfamily